MGLSVDTYDSKFYAPAFGALDADPDFCAQEGPKIAPLIDRLVEMGGVIDAGAVSMVGRGGPVCAACC